MMKELKEARCIYFNPGAVVFKMKKANLRFLPNYTIIITSKELTRVDTEIDVSIGKNARSQYVDFSSRVKVHIKNVLLIFF